jgi:two-component system, OmpR family, sensor histidine kinase QseC
MTGWLKQVRSFLQEPSLVRRGFVSVLLAFILVWMVLVGYIYYNVKQTIAHDSGLQKFGNALTLSLTDVKEREQATALIASTAIWVNIRRREIGLLPGIMQFELLALDGQRIYATSQLDQQLLIGASGQLLEQELLGQTHRIYQNRTHQWQLRIAEPKRSDADILSYNSRALLPYLMLALPIVLLAVWLSVRHGLHPLRQLADHIAARKDNELSPVNFATQHQELKPLVHSLDSMLTQLRHKVARERAFVQDAAHEIRTPMAVITVQAHVMARAQSADERMQAQQQLNHAIERASHLAQQLLDLASLDDAQRTAPRTFDVAQWLRLVLAQAAPAAMAREIELSLEAPDSFLCMVEMPVLESIVSNLLDNAVRYGKAQGAVVVTLSGDSSSLCLTVKDDGCGIAPEDRVRVFERFYRGAGHDETGSGLGLAIVQQACRRLGGSVKIVAGLQGRGVGFSIQIPMV